MIRILNRVVLFFVLIAFFASSALAFDLGGKMKDVSKDAAKGASKKVVENEINKSLKEKNCSFKPKTTTLTCDVEDILSTLKNEKTVAEKSGFARNVEIYAEVGRGKDPKNSKLEDQRLQLVRNELKKKINWWNWNDSVIDGDKLILSVKIQ